MNCVFKASFPARSPSLLQFSSSSVDQLAISRHLTECQSHTESLIPLSKCSNRNVLSALVMSRTVL